MYVDFIIIKRELVHCDVMFNPSRIRCMAAITTMNAPAAATLLINGRVLPLKDVREVENNFWWRQKPL